MLGATKKSLLFINNLKTLSMVVKLTSHWATKTLT